MGLTIAFWILAVMIVLAAVGVIMQKNVFRAALALIVVLVAVAGIFITLNADFLAGAQILIYVGAISVVIILAIMLTREFTHGSPSNRLRIPALIVAAAFFGLLVFAVVKTDWQVVTSAPQTPTTANLGEQLFTQHGFLLPVEITAVLILAVVIGAIAIAREK
jgi:NADH:ubiquinone oxidoreductase subunit 6 (subunit J)